MIENETINLIMLVRKQYYINKLENRPFCYKFFFSFPCHFLFFFLVIILQRERKNPPNNNERL